MPWAVSVTYIVLSTFCFVNHELKIFSEIPGKGVFLCGCKTPPSSAIPLATPCPPFIHQRLFALEGIPVSYQVLDVPDLPAALPALRELDCFNITIPHKSAILPFLDGLEEKARLFGSVNTVQVKEGKLLGFTTDGAGCYKALENHGCDFSGRVLLLGNGGAARALAFEAAARQRDLDLTIACRESSQPKAVALAQEVAAYLRRRGDRGFRLSVQTYGELETACAFSTQASPNFALLLNATSVGMYPHAGESPVSAKVVARCRAVFDAVYNPAQTQLLRLAGEAGALAIGGMEMLVYQAVAAHEIWYGHPLPPGGHRRPLPRCGGGAGPAFPGKGVRRLLWNIRNQQRRNGAAPGAGPASKSPGPFRGTLCCAALWAAAKAAWGGGLPSCWSASSAIWTATSSSRPA